MTTGYVIKRLDQGGGYVAPPGSPKSYVRDWTKARRFPTREQAQADCCGNERAVSISDLLGA